MVSFADDLELVGEADTGADAIAVAKQARPDVFLIDIRMPGLDRLEATRRITSDPSLTSTRIIMLTTFDLDDYVRTRRYATAPAAFSSRTPGQAHPERRPDRGRPGEALLAPSVTRRLIERFTTTPPTGAPTGRARPVTERESEVLVLVAHGRSNAEIADHLHISLYTAKTHVSRILSKLHAHDRAQLVVLAYETGLVTPGT